MDELEKFLEEREKKIPIPSGELARVKLLAKELAGSTTKDYGIHRKWVGAGSPQESNVCIRRISWEMASLGFPRQRVSPSATLLYPTDELYDLELRNVMDFDTVSFALIDETEPYNVFISYKRSESSAFALLARFG